MSAWDDLVSGLDQERQMPAVREERNAVVAAGAGSGKTRVLAVRYLWLVKEKGLSPERILCLTFTNKAAAEMRERIRGMLAACAADGSDGSGAVFRKALDDYQRARVSTIDSFCSEIARTGSAAWGVSPDFDIDERAASESIRVLAMDYLLRRRDEPLARSFLAAVGFERAVDALAGLARAREGLLGAVSGPADGAGRFSPEAQEALMLEALAGVHEELRGLLRGGLEYETATASEKWADRARALPPEPPASADADVLGAALAEYRLVRALRRPSSSSAVQADLYYNDSGERIKALAELGILACEALLDPSRSQALAFLEGFYDEAVAARASSGSLAFGDVASMAVTALERDLPLRAWYKSSFDAVMIDEFQDDNELQKRLLYLLAERRNREAPGLPGPADLAPGVLFFVGDEKQSIYRFRGADVSVFRGLAAELAASPGGLGAHGLDVNWRSEPALIEFFNDTFSRVMPAPGDAEAQPYEARFAGLGAGPATPGVEPAVVYLESREPEDEDGLQAAELEAWKIAELVRGLVDGGVMVTAKGPGGTKRARPCEYGDIAVLYRSSASQNRVERFFRLLGVPYTATATAGLFVESVVGDIYAVLRLAAYPGDRLAMASCLRGPFAGVSDDAAFRLLASLPPDGFAGGPAGGSAGAPGAPGPGSLPFAAGGDDEARLAAFRETWAAVRRMADRRSLRSMVEYLWYDRGLRWNVLRRPENAAYLEHFDYLWSMAADADRRGDRLVDFLADLEPRMGEIEKLEDTPIVRETARGVSIMTVHASKGLEFPVVIVPNIDNAGRNDSRAPVSDEGRFGPSMKTLDDSGAVVDRVARFDAGLSKADKHATGMSQALAETARLFYVASTRAISRLYLLGRVPSRADQGGASFRGLLLRAWPWAGPVSRSDEAFVPGRPEGLRSVFRVEAVAPRDSADYARLSRGQGAGYARAAAAAEAEAGASIVLGREARWAVTAAAAALGEASAALGQSSAPPTAAALGEASAVLGQSSAPPATGSPDAAGHEAWRAGELFPGMPPLDEPPPHEGTGEYALADKDFGTLCHELLESALARPGSEPEPSPAMAAALERLPPSAKAAALAEALVLTRAFLASERGLALARAARAAREPREAHATRAAAGGAVFETEYPFVWRGEAGGRPVFLSGSMDAVYGQDEGVTVIDWKTDRLVEPERHAFQLSVYREAAEAIFDRPARAFLCYLRTGEEVEITASPDLASLGESREFFIQELQSI